MVSAIIALSVYGNMLSLLFSGGRSTFELRHSFFLPLNLTLTSCSVHLQVVQELARESILPYSAFFASNKPFGAPFAGLLWQWAICSAIAVAPPPGDAFDFILQGMYLSQTLLQLEITVSPSHLVTTYPITLASLFVTAGLLFLHSPYAKARSAWAWDPPFKAWTSVTVFFLVSNVFLIIVPLVPPAPGMEVFESLPYWVRVFFSFLPKRKDDVTNLAFQ